MAQPTQQIPAGWKMDLEKETALIAYLDLSNMFHWQKVLKWRFRIEDVISGLFRISGIKEVKVYYGMDERNYKRSKSFHKRIRKTGAILKTKFATDLLILGNYIKERKIILIAKIPPERRDRVNSKNKSYY